MLVDRLCARVWSFGSSVATVMVLFVPLARREDSRAVVLAASVVTTTHAVDLEIM